jgi:transposase
MKHNHTSILRELYAFKGFRISQVFLTEKELRIFLEKTVKTGACPGCGKKCRKIEEAYERTVRDLDCVGRIAVITFRQYKIRCSCGYRGIEILDFIDKYSFCTKRLEEYVFLLCQKMSIKDAAQLCRLNWKTVKNIDKKYLRQLVTPLSELTPERIGVDEIAHEKRHKYLTVVRDLDLKRVVWVGKDRRKETMDEFFSELGEEKARRIRTAVMDMHDPYIASVSENCPDAEIIFDKFHISKKVNEALDSVRKEEFSKADAEERKNMKRKRFLILSRQKRLDDEQRETVDDLKRINARLYEAYLLKEQALDIFEEKNVHGALVRLGKWIANVERLGIEAYQKVINTMRNYWYGIVNYFKYRFTNAASEGFNNKINVIKRRAYGFRDLEYLKLKILQSCGWRSS